MSDSKKEDQPSKKKSKTERRERIRAEYTKNEPKKEVPSKEKIKRMTR